MTKKENKNYKCPAPTIVSVAEGKKRFSDLMCDAEKDNKEFIVTKRGKPVAVIIPYEEYKQSKRLESYKKIMFVREAFLNSGVSANEVFKESKKQLSKMI